MNRCLLVTLAVVAGLALGLGCGPSPDEFVQPATATVTGTVLETVSNAPNPFPVASCRITLEVGNNAPSRGFLGPFFTNNLGSYLIPNIPAGVYDLVADKIVTVSNTPTPLRGRIRFIELAPGETRPLPDLVIRPPGVLNGTAFLGGASAGGNGGITVHLEGTIRQTTTDASGAFAFADMEAGIYSAVFRRSGFVEEVLHQVEVVSGATTTITTTLEPLTPQAFAAITGQAVVEPRDPVTGDHGGVTVTVEGTSRTLVTTPGGFFRFDNLPLALYTLRFERDGTFTRRVPNIQLRTGETVRNLGRIQLDTHRAIAPNVRAFDLEHSPNGTQVAFINRNGELAVMDREGAIFQQVLTSGARAAFDAQTGLGRGLSWSPDGTEILFVRFEGFPSLPFRIGVAPSAGGAVRTLLTSGNEYYTPAWAPDGRAFSYYLTPNLRRVDVSRDTLGRTTAVASTDRVISGNQPPGAVTVVSGLEAAATGRVVYSFATTANSNGIFSAFALGGVDPIGVLPALPGGQTLPGAESPTFTPDASRIAFSYKVTDTALRGIYLMNLDGSGATRITTRAGNNLDFSPDGRRIVFTNPDAASLGQVLEVLVPR